MILGLKEIHTFYGQSHILYDISLNIDSGEVVCLLGRNGAGKSTTLKSIIGIVPPRSGSIRFKGNDITGYRPFKIARMGIGYVPEDRRIFPNIRYWIIWRWAAMEQVKSNGTSTGSLSFFPY